MYIEKITPEMIVEYISVMDKDLLVLGGFDGEKREIEIKSIEKSEKNNGYICKIEVKDFLSVELLIQEYFISRRNHQQRNVMSFDMEFGLNGFFRRDWKVTRDWQDFMYEKFGRDYIKAAYAFEDNEIAERESSAMKLFNRDSGMSK
ncbi:MAG: hypothetical protein IJA22_00085 [Clostridia bacterium]|nr:hypothetical protein [Clostridia bacterium]